MKNMMNIKFGKVLGLSSFMLLGIVFSCSDSFLDQPAKGALSESVLLTQPGIEQTLIGAYSALKGGNGGSWGGSLTGWVYGSVRGEEAYKGSNSGDQSDINPLTNFAPSATNNYLQQKWTATYDGVNRANLTLKLLAKVPAGVISDADTKRIQGEAIFLRAVYHFEARKIWGMAPYVDETIDYNLGNYYVANDHDIITDVIADLQKAMALLPATQAAAGRANYWLRKHCLVRLIYMQRIMPMHLLL